MELALPRPRSFPAPTAVLISAALLLPAMLPAQQQSQEGQLDASQTLFTVLAAINAAGYDANLDSNANSPSANRSVMPSPKGIFSPSMR